MDATPTSTSRRRVVQGLAWAAPAVAMTAAAPAFAASRCTPTVRFSGGIEVNWGSDTRPSTHQLVFGGQVWVDNLPAGTTVTRVTERYFIQNAIGQDSTGDGYWFMGNSRTNWYKSTSANKQCRSVGCQVEWTGPIGAAQGVDYTTAPGKGDPTGVGWTSTVKNTVNGVSTVFPNGVSYPAWDATLTWTNAKGSGITGTGDCRNFTTGPTGRFGVNYGADSLDPKSSGAPIKDLNAHARGFAVVTITLNIGAPLEYVTKVFDVVNTREK